MLPRRGRSDSSVSPSSTPSPQGSPLLAQQPESGASYETVSYSEDEEPELVVSEHEEREEIEEEEEGEEEEEEQLQVVVVSDDEEEEGGAGEREKDEAGVTTETTSAVAAVARGGDMAEEGSTRLSVQVRIVFPVRGTKMPLPAAKQYIVGVLGMCCNARVGRLLRCAPLPHADYEHAFHELIYELELPAKEDSLFASRSAIAHFLSRFCAESAFGLHQQIVLELPRLTAYFNEIKPEDRFVDVSSFSLGNCPSAGLFFSRANYFSGRNNRPANAKVPSIRPAGTRDSLSYASFEHDRRQFALFFAVPLSRPRPDGLAFACYKITFPYAALRQVVVDAHEKSTVNIFMQLKHPPALWELLPSLMLGVEVVKMHNSNNGDWRRTLSWPGGATGALGCSKKTLGDNSWLRIDFQRKIRATTADSNTASSTYSFSSARDESLSRFLSLLARVSARSPTVRISFAAVTSVMRVAAPFYEPPSLGTFRADYAYRAILARGAVVTDDLFDPRKSADENTACFLTKYLLWCMKECSVACEEALECVLAALDEKRNFSLLRCFDHIYTARVDMYRRCNMEQRAVEAIRVLPPNCVLIRKVMVTPLRILPMQPDVMMTNRVVRRFGCEHALRAVFRDDNGTRIRLSEFAAGGVRAGGSSDVIAPIIISLIKDTMVHPLSVCGRDYFFLAWSNSQMRDHGCYMYSPFRSKNGVEVTIEAIREWMGDFRDSRTVPKLMSRMGQCFTQAQPAVRLRRCDWRVDEDVEGGRGHPETREPFCFSDGVGRIEPGLAREMAEKLELKMVPSCYQVRFKGFKGVLTVDRSLAADGHGVKVVFRKSQKKFVDVDEEQPSLLEVVKYSMPSTVCLNRQMLTILDFVSEKQGLELHGKVTGRVHYYLEKELSTISSMLLLEKEAALALTERLPIPIDFHRLSRCGVRLTAEPYFRQMLVACYHHALSQHLAKAKLELPASVGRCMYGVLDETGLLQAGQVFVQYSPGIRNPSDQPVLHLGKVIVSKNPCHSPGDVRVFSAVWQPALAHLIDVIVFPRYGPRPHPDEMAGGDLDGDEYSVIFDPDLMFDHNEEAMIFPKMSAQQYEFTPTTEDMADFFLKYLQQDAIGMVSNAHLYMADKKGLFHKTCDGLARKCSIAVDFPKSGEPSEPLELDEKAKELPDFAEKTFKQAYRSERLNGQMFRRVKRIEDVIQLCEKSTSLFDDNIDLMLYNPTEDPWDGDMSRRRKTIKLRNQYASEIQQILDEYGVGSEAAAISGKMVTVKRLAAMEKDDYTFYNTEKIVELRVQKIFAKYRAEFFSEFGGEEHHLERDDHGDLRVKSDEAMRRKARSWYLAAYVDEEAAEGLHEEGAGGGWGGEEGGEEEGATRRKKIPMLRLPCRSLPWIMWDVLADYRVQASLRRDTNGAHRENPVAQRLSAAINEHLNMHPLEYADFMGWVGEQDEAIQRYAHSYGPEICHVLFVLDGWLRKERMYWLCPLRLVHLARLLLQFCLGVRHQGDCAHVESTAQPLFMVKLPYSSSTTEQSRTAYGGAIREPGELLLRFLAYLGSVAFATSTVLDLSLHDDSPIPSPVLTRPVYWIPLSNLAFKTIHAVCVAGNFSFLGLGDCEASSEERGNGGEGERIGRGKRGRQGEGRGGEHSETWAEGIEPHVIHVDLIPDGRPGIDAIETLKAWSGVTDLVRKKCGKFEWMLTVAGNTEARQRLARILQLPADQLKHAIRHNRCPAAALYDRL